MAKEVAAFIKLQLPQTSSFEPGMASARSIETRARVVSRAFASRAISSSAMKQTA